MGQPLLPEPSTHLYPHHPSNSSNLRTSRQDMPTDPPQRLQRRKVLVAMETEIEALQVHELSTSQLKSLNIVVERISLDRNSERKPYFFKPHAVGLPQPDEETINNLQTILDRDTFAFTRPYNRCHQVNNNWESYAFQFCYDPQFNGPWSSKCVADYKPYKSLYQYDQPYFGAFRMTDIPGDRFPHTMAVVYNNLETNDDEILRGELLIILRLMLGQYKKLRFIGHMTVPVLLFSLAGKIGRIIEAYCDGQRLILRATALYSFRNQTATAFKDFADWYLGEPIGDTVKP